MTIPLLGNKHILGTKAMEVDNEWVKMLAVMVEDLR